MSDKVEKSDKIEKLFRENYRRLYYYALTIIQDAQSAEDIVCDAFHGLWEHQSRLSDQSSEAALKALLYVSVKNGCIDHLRHMDVSRRYEEYVLKMADLLDEPDPAGREEKIPEIMRAVENMPPQMQKVFRGCFLEGKKYQEMSDEMGISPNTVKDHVMKALKTLRDKFNGR